MKATVPTAELRRIVGTAGRAVGRAALPVLTGVRLEVDDDGTLTATGSDLDLTMTAATTLDGGDAGVVVVPSAQLAKVLGKVRADAVTLTVDDHDLHLGAGRSRVRLPLLPADEWPRLPPVAGEPCLLDDDVWGRIARVATAASTEMARPIICSVCFADGWAAATNTFALHVTEVPAALDALVPAKALREARAHLDGAVTMATDANVARFAAGATSVTVRLTAGAYAQWPMEMGRGRSHAQAFTVESTDLLAAIDLAATFATTDHPGPVKVHLPDTTTVEVGRAAPDAGEGTTTLLGSATSPFTLAYNPTYLAGAVRAVAPDGGPVKVAFTNELQTAYLSGAGVEAVVMAVRT